ncbi:hypothetical protein AVEN_67336-1 [Araneus ventricosus]|uniref:Endonuclease/exonuclease/phosphatase domain-containing protein n=1 Tax=Araneus ventricosus TaxID=182803 RepID=A0A4Y2Q1I4_ARAVE|nr:hypothetical protein AVEN_67336-1 [Araneus ventricosus]
MADSSFKEIKFVQVNLHQAKAATTSLVQRAEDQNISVACVQEMYYVRSKPVGIPAKYKLYTSLRDKLKTGIILFQQDLTVMKICASTNTIGVIIKYRNHNLLVISVCCPSREDINSILSELESCLQHPHDKVVIMGDFNSKSPVWGSDVEDERGCDLLEFA